MQFVDVLWASLVVWSEGWSSGMKSEYRHSNLTEIRAE